MKLLTFFILFLSCLLTACSVNDDEVGIDGRILHMNQADFYLYSTDGVIDGIDTIHVQGGRFDYLSQINKDGTLVMVFPNFSQMPLFVKGGQSISVEGDASKMKELDISGGDYNKIFTEWRKENAEGSFAQQKAKATKFIEENPDSPISIWMLQSYYITSQTPDIKGAIALLNKVLKISPNNLELKKMHTLLSESGDISVNDKIGHFSATDVFGRSVNESILQSGTTIIMTFATWNFDSQNMLRVLANRLRNKNTDSKYSPDHVIAVSLDADSKECKRVVEFSNADNVMVICDGKQFDSPLLMSLHLTSIPSNIVVRDGKVIDIDISTNKL